jgi:translation initiation factor 1
MAKKDKERVNVVYSTNPDFEYKYEEQPEMETLPIAKQKLKISLDKKMRKGKEVTLISNFVGKTEDLEALAKILKTYCGIGGSVKDGEIILQGDLRDKIKAKLTDLGYKIS